MVRTNHGRPLRVKLPENSTGRHRDASLEPTLPVPEDASVRTFLIAILVLRAAVAAPEPPSVASCKRAHEVAIPAANQPDAEWRKAFAGCKSEELLYGIGRKADPEAARLCAYVERADGDQVVFGG